MQREDTKRSVAWCCMTHTIQDGCDLAGICITAD